MSHGGQGRRAGTVTNSMDRGRGGRVRLKSILSDTHRHAPTQKILFICVQLMRCCCFHGARYSWMTGMGLPSLGGGTPLLGWSRAAYWETGLLGSLAWSNVNKSIGHTSLQAQRSHMKLSLIGIRWSVSVQNGGGMERSRGVWMGGVRLRGEVGNPSTRNSRVISSSCSSKWRLVDGAGVKGLFSGQWPPEQHCRATCPSIARCHSSQNTRVPVVLEDSHCGASFCSLTCCDSFT